MAIFTVHVPPGIADPLARADRTVFIPEGFSLPAFLFGPLYLLYRQLWLSALGWVMVAAGIGIVTHQLDLPAAFGLLLVLLLALLTGLEARESRRQSLTRRGYIFATLLAGVSRDEGERLFFSAGPPRMPVPRATSGTPAEAAAVIGIFPEQEGLP